MWMVIKDGVVQLERYQNGRATAGTSAASKSMGQVDHFHRRWHCPTGGTPSARDDNAAV